MYRVMQGKRLVLASASPRRLEMLGRLGLHFDMAPAQIDEAILPGEDAAAAAQRLAQLKAAAISAVQPGAAVLAADPRGTADHRILGKPENDAQAREMLHFRSGREHRVVTGFCLRNGGKADWGLAETRVRFRTLSTAEIQAYVASGEPRDKAGAYAVQGSGAALVEAVSGSYTNVVGLPLSACVVLLIKRGVIEPMPTARPGLH
ncbi:MAG: Maf family protein [Pseudomonadota bacterium]